ncbi:hypothetical protein BY458DRAFT_591344 [Sporodiniella umbellata]|nr:hypothetical protein BY458DRAFT_591344 [Sporodiniella umbellata]
MSLSDFKETESDSFINGYFDVLEKKESSELDTLEIKNKIAQRQIETDSLLHNTDLLEKKIELVESSISRKRKRISTHTLSEKKYSELNKELQRQIQEAHLRKKQRQLPNNNNNNNNTFLTSLQSMQKQIEKAIQLQCESGKTATDTELEAIQKSIKKIEPSTALDVSSHALKTLEAYSVQIKTENKAQYQVTKLERANMEKEKLHKDIKQHCKNRLLESRRLLQLKTKLEHETKEAELQLAKKIKELPQDSTIQNTLKKMLRLRGACEQVKIEVETTNKQLDSTKLQVQDQRADDLVKKLNHLKDSIAENQTKVRSLLKANTHAN